MPAPLRIPLDAFLHFVDRDGFAIASHIALSTLMSLFPFLIVVTAFAGLLGSKSLADEAGRLLLDAWPPEVAEPIAREIRRVATEPQAGNLTFGALFAVYFASSGLESLRIGLNRAYETPESRSWWLLRLESIFYVIGSAAALLALSVLVVLGPLITDAAARYFDWFAPFETMVTLARYGVATLILALTLLSVHAWLPAGRRRFLDILPGVLATLLLWLVAGAAFGRYLAAFSERYALTYAGLASAMIALVFLYFSGVIFIYGGELNAAIVRARRGAR
ncbi:YihY/virulence factor BrkB family protein [Methylosinus sporium]|uniref:YihY/virulence factor BrkB family protein n=1 Tax=Methylosinus sporium TaxID=428 RepID=A0A549SDH2_METSR|nr:YihY/virulence factor BrkB family protein [Methylosinus sp. KRF6]TRL26181.1 YihY/virulence factor BrkB family protein [Methylosinus sporium]